MCGCLPRTPYWGPGRQPRQACALTWNQTSDPSVHGPELNPLSYTSRGYILFYKLIFQVTYHENFLMTLSPLQNHSLMSYRTKELSPIPYCAKYHCDTHSCG